jgi:WD40 repeat protein
VRSLCWTNQDDRWVLTAGDDLVARIWDARHGKLIVEMDKHTEAIMQAMFTSDDSKVITLGIDKQLIVWEVYLNEENGS